MTPEAQARFAALPRLDRANVMAAAVPCKVCASPAPFFDVTDFSQSDAYGPSGITVSWYRCPHCGFLFTPLCDDWTPDDFRRFIYNDDHLLIDGDYPDARPRRVAKWAAEVLAEYRDARILDYGGGNGLFARLMREAGFHRLEAYDPISMPGRPEGPFDIITCLEVIEHSPWPVETLADMRSFLADDGVILLNEALQPPDIDQIRCSWWFCGTRNGHLRPFADRTFAELCGRAELVFHRGAREAHAMRRGRRFVDLAKRQGPALTYYRLGAPSHGADGKFHGVEDIPGWQFRWTAAEVIEWPITVPPETDRVQVLIPFRNQSTAGFAAECRLGFGGTEVLAGIRESSLFAEFDVSAAGPAIVTLRTPPLRPGSGSDTRSTGIALRVVAGPVPLDKTNETHGLPQPWVDARQGDLLSEMKAVASEVSRWREARRLEMDYLKGPEDLGLEDHLNGWVRFNGPNWHFGLIEVMDQIAGKLSSDDRQLTRGDVFDASGEIKIDVVQARLPGFNAHYPRAAAIDEFERFELLPEFENPFSEFALPFPLNRNMARPTGSSFAVYRARNADLYLSALGYQLFRAEAGIFWPAASTRAYAQEGMTGPHVTFDGCVVIVQDAFEGSNFCHFLYDWITRLGHFLYSGLEDPSLCTFIMGGIPTEFHFHVIRAVCEIFFLDDRQFIFPREPETWHISGNVYFFSDLKGANLHPAQMAHWRSIAIIRDVCSRIRTKAGTSKRIYISRGDTPLRRIANEADLLRELELLGFVAVQLGSRPILEQIEIMRGADVIVAPHGMGLTHIAFHEGCPLIVELHNPSIGTDSYAFPARALGFRYRSILGTDLGGPQHHFSIDPQAVVAVLREEGISSAPAADDAAAPPDDVACSSRIQTKFLGGVQSTGAIEVSDIAPPVAGDPVYRHVRDDNGVQPDNNIGWLEVTGLTKGEACHCTCEVWLPADRHCDRVTLSCAGLDLTLARPANMRIRDHWQTIGINGTATAELVNFVLRCDADAGAVMYSSAWRFGTGSWKA